MPPIFSSAINSQDFDRLDIQSIRVLIAQVNEYLHKILEDPVARDTLRQRCTSKLNVPKQEYFEFSEHATLSNLYWAIENIEAAIKVKWPEEKLSLLRSSERMLQVPALVQEHGSTGGIQNQYLICCSYFYLSVVRKLQGDDWQVTLHFLQAMLVCPRLVRAEFMPELWERVFLPQIMRGRQESELRFLHTEHHVDHFDNAFDEATRQLARRYKDWLMYYQVMLYGEIPQKNCAAEAPPLGEVSRNGTYSTSVSSEYLDSVEHGNGWPVLEDGEKVHPIDFEDNVTSQFKNGGNDCSAIRQLKSVPHQDDKRSLGKSGADCKSYSKETFCLRSLQDMLKDSQSDTPVSAYSSNDSPEGSPTKQYIQGNHSEKNMDEREDTVFRSITDADNSELQISHRKLQNICSISNQGCIEQKSPDATGCPFQREDHDVYYSNFSRRFLSCISVLEQPTLGARENDSDDTCNGCVEGMKQRGTDLNTFCIMQPEGTNLRASETRVFRLFDHISSKSSGNYGVNHKEQNGSSTRKKEDSNKRRNSSRSKLQHEKDINTDIVGTFEKAISTLCISDWIGQCEESLIEISTMWELLNTKTETKYGLLKEEILDHLLKAISTSKEERVIRASVFTLTAIISKNEAVIEDIKRKGLRLCDLASALKRNVHEAVILIYLINPSPAEIKALELLPVLLEVACSSKTKVPVSVQLTPLAASLRMIEVFVTAFDFTTNSMHMAVITSPAVLTRLVHDAINRYTEEIISLAAVLIKCMRFDGRCKRTLAQFASMSPFIRLLGSKEKPAKYIALQFFHEILQMPRSSATNLLRQIQRSESISTTRALLSCIGHLEPNYQILASNLLLQLEMLDDSSGKSSYKEVAMEVLLTALTMEGSSEQVLSASILANLGGTYSWAGEPYTVAWLVKRSGLKSKNQMNMMRYFDWSDESLYDGDIDAWCSKVVKDFITTGNPMFHALEKGLQSKTRSVSRNSLTIITWIGCAIGKISPIDLRFSACEILLSGLEQFLHPGVDLDERLLACLSIYNYAAGKGMQKLRHLSEGVRESLRRLSSITWIADELLKVTEYLLPANSRVSCVHTQVLEAGHSCKVAVSALIYYKGQLHSGHSDGTIKVWDIKEQTAILGGDVRLHKKEVTCFALSEPGDNLLSASADKTIRVWQMVRRRLECVKVIEAKEKIYKLESYKSFVFAITQSRGVKVFDTTRTCKTVCGSKHVKCMAVIEGKLYLGCKDSSVQEVDITYEREREIKAPAKRWWVQNKPVNGILGYKDWLYIASTLVEGSILKDWRKHKEAQMSMSIEKGKCVQAMEVVEDFIYLNCSLSPSIIEIWLRGAQRKVGRLSAGSKITSILTANDVILCGTETGLIKGWIPL